MPRKDPRFNPKYQKNLQDDKKRGTDIVKETITTDNIADGSITASKFAPGAISTASLEDNSVTAAKIATGAVSNDEINTGASPTVNTIYTNNWFRSNGSTGWYNQTYGGGVYMVDPTWVRTYGSKNLYCNAEIRGNRITSESYIQPAAGIASAGIIFPSNPGGGGGDTAHIKYWAYSGEACVMSIAVENDANDYISITAPGSLARVGPNGTVYLRGNQTTSTVAAAADGSHLTDWPGGWGGGLATFDICCASIRLSGTSTRSDRRYKEHIKDIESCLSDVIKLNPVTFNWKKEVKFYNPDLQYGFIAQDVEEIFPELIQDDETGYKSVNTNAFVPMLVKCIQEQQEQIESQQKTIESLEARLKALEDLLK